MTNEELTQAITEAVAVHQANLTAWSQVASADVANPAFDDTVRNSMSGAFKDALQIIFTKQYVKTE
jgi:hypothetical protein